MDFVVITISDSTGQPIVFGSSEDMQDLLDVPGAVAIQE